MKIILMLAASIVLSACARIDNAIHKPEQFRFGSSVSEVEGLMEGLCDEYTIRQIVPPTGPLVEKTQTQIDCSGFDYVGKSRHIELVFQDDKLDIIWILIPEKERPAFVKKFKSAYGNPTMEIEFGAVFLQANAAIRNTPPEVLFASDRQVKAMLKELDRE